MRTKRNSSAAGPSVEYLVADVGRELARTFSGVLDALPAHEGGRLRPQRLARSLGLNTVLTSRLLKAARQSDPLAVAHVIPGPEPLRRLLRAAERKKIDPSLIHKARLAVDRFEQLIDNEAGDRSALDAIISGWLPDAREKVELIAKQSIFRGISQLLGTASELEHYTVLLHPSSQRADQADQVWLCVNRGLKRVRPGLVVKYDTIHTRHPLLTVTGKPVDGLHGLLLEQFCSRPLPKLDVSRVGDRAQYTLSGDEVGIRSAVNLAHATLVQRIKKLHRSAGDPPQKATLAVGIASPSRTFIFDVLLHVDVYAGQQPTLHLYRAMPYGPASPNDPARDVDRLDVIQAIQPLGQGIAKFRATENPEHVDMLRHVCEQRQWDASALRGYRCRIEFPIYSSETVMAFNLPQ